MELECFAQHGTAVLEGLKSLTEIVRPSAVLLRILSHLSAFLSPCLPMGIIAVVLLGIDPGVLLRRFGTKILLAASPFSLFFFCYVLRKKRGDSPPPPPIFFVSRGLPFVHPSMLSCRIHRKHMTAQPFSPAQSSQAAKGKGSTCRSERDTASMQTKLARASMSRIYSAG